VAQHNSFAQQSEISNRTNPTQRVFQNTTKFNQPQHKPHSNRDQLKSRGTNYNNNKINNNNSEQQQVIILAQSVSAAFETEISF
jgi:hypothetical protein